MYISITKDGYSAGQSALIGLQPQQGASDGYYRYLNSFMWDISDGDSEHVFVFVNPSYRPATVSSSTGIENTMATDVKDDTWYTLNGRRLQGKPTTKGIYIYKGKKQIIK